MAIPGDLILTDDVPSTFSARVIEAFRSRALDTFSIALSGGGTARDCYEDLATTAGNQIDWWKVDVYWGDERCVPHDHPDSNYRLAREALLDRVGAANATHLMRCTEGADPYQLRIGDLGRIDLVHLGLGNNPYERMTLTFAGIARARLVIVTVAGEAKADPLARIAAGEDLPASRIEADQVVWLVDPAAASGLSDDTLATAVTG